MNSARQTKKSKRANKKHSFSLKDGFYELPYLVNSPHDMVEAFKKIPAVQVDEKKQSITNNTRALNAVVYYREVEKGLFLIYSEVKFKSNIRFRHFVDKQKKPSEYYCLSLRIDYYSKVTNSLANGISYTDNSWLILKPEAKVDHYHFKGTKGRYISVYFTSGWIKSNYKVLPSGARGLLNLFLNSDSDHLICPELPEKGVYRYDPDNLSRLLVSAGRSEKTNFNKLKKQMHEFFSAFVFKMQSEKVDARHFDVSNQERIKVMKAEKIIGADIYNKFPGIGYLSNETGLSGTKLKECFKKVYGKSLFQYFRGRQMEEARTLITSTHLPLGRIANEFGYTNAAKFATAFKSEHGVLPSKIQRIGQYK